MIGFADIILEHSPPFPILVAGFAVAAVLTLLFFLRFLPKSWASFGVLLLRLIFLTVLAWCILMPLEQDQFTEQFRQRFIVLLDQSASMQLAPDDETPNRWDTSQEFLRLPWVRHLEREFIVDYHMFDQQFLNPDGIEALRNAAPDGTGTHLQQAMRALTDRYRGQDVAGIVLMTDGLDTREVDDSWAVGPWFTRIFPLEVEAPAVWEQEPDLRVETVLTQRRVLVGWETALNAVVSGQGAGTAPVSVQLYRDVVGEDGQTSRELIQEIPTQIPADGGRREVVFTLPNDEVGNFTYTVRVPPLPDERVVEDNQFSVTVQVIEAQNRLIYLEGLPRWESRYLSRALRANPDFNPTIFVYATGEFMAIGDASGVSLDLTDEELAPFSIVILGNFEGEIIGTERAESILRFVEDGGSLIVVGGPAAWGPRGLFDSPLRAILPFRRPPSNRPEEGRFSTRLTREGREHPAFSRRTEGNLLDWTQVPPVLSVYPAGELSPGATTLVEVETTTGRHPLIITLRYGQGRVMALMTDSLYRWQLEPGEGRPYLRFWNQILNWLRPVDREQETDVLDLFADADQVYLGDTVQLTARVPDRLADQAGEGSVTLLIRLPDGRQVTLPMARQTLPTGTGQTFVGHVNQFTAIEAGLHRATARARIGETTLESGPYTFFVRSFTAENEPRPANRTVLETLAESSEGLFAGGSELNEFLLRQRGEAREESRLTTHTLWNLWPILACLIGLLVLEWIVRKLRNLV